MHARDSIRHELIGLTLEVVDADNPSLIGLQGRIIDETKNTLTIQTKEKSRKLLKKQLKVKIKFDSKEIIIEGSKLAKRPEERIK